MRKIKISAGNISVTAELNDSSTANAIWDALPITGSGNRWGDEIYFGIPVHLDEESSAKAEVKVGDLAYWAPGHAFCIFFGQTPASSNEQPRAASPVNLFGHINGDATQFKNVKSGVKVIIEPI